MAPKKQNAFMLFVHEWRKGRNMTVPEAVNRCGPLWSAMTAQQQGPYKAAAKDANVAARSHVDPLNCHGIPLSTVEQEDREAAEQVMKMKQFIDRIVVDGRARDDLENVTFNFVAFNFFTKAHSNDIYIPAEFAASHFSLKSGRTSVYSTHINPGQLIFGQGCDTQNHTSSTHQLPLPPNALGESNMGRLYMNIVDYLHGCQKGRKPKDPLVVFTATNLMPVVKGCFRYLASDSEHFEEEIHVYDIQYLMYVLKKEVMEVAQLPHNSINKNITDNLFLNDFFEYCSGISCQFHEENDRAKYCTQSMVTRWCYTFSDYMCGDLAIKTLPGKHMPPKQELKFTVKSPDGASANTSFASCSTLQSEVKREYVPKDHSVFSGNLSATSDFPSLGSRKSKSTKQANSSREAVWHIPAGNRCPDDFDFSM